MKVHDLAKYVWSLFTKRNGELPKNKNSGLQ
jgi:hypothetical protein